MRSIYQKPDGPLQISFSGGRTSGYLLHQFLDANDGLPNDTVVTFANTGREMQETLDFVDACSKAWDVPIVCLEFAVIDGKASYRVTDYDKASLHGEPFEILLKRKKYLPNVVARFCTADLKIRPMKRYLVKELGWKKWTAALGIRADEQRRINYDSKDRWSFWYPLVEANISKRDVQLFWQQQEFDLNLKGINGKTPQGNCDFCFLKSEATLAMMAKEYPHLASWWVRMEQDIGSTFRKGRDLAEFVDFVQRQGEFDFDETGFYCQTDDGECVI